MPPTQALLEHAVLFLEILDHIQVTAVDPPSEYHEQQLKRLKSWEHCGAVYRLTNHCASSSGRLAVLRSRRSNFWTLRDGRRCFGIRFAGCLTLAQLVSVNLPITH